MDNYRVFVSYSHENLGYAQQILATLRETGLDAKSDADLPPGQDYRKAIMNLISHCHVFVPLLTEQSSQRGWVHQEIGYAAALNVPILPVTIEQNPTGIIEYLQAKKLDVDPETGRLRNLDKVFNLGQFEDLVKNEFNLAVFECAMDPLTRTRLIAKYCKAVRQMGYCGQVRQKGALTTFNIPDKPLNNRVWRDRDGPHVQPDLQHEALREERRSLENHAKERGCKLIVDPYHDHRGVGPAALVVRLQTLVDFLESPNVADVQIALCPEGYRRQSRIIVGDYFLTESLYAETGKGYRQTMFTRHAPTICRRIEEFDDEFADLLERTETAPAASRERAIAALKGKIEELKREASATSGPSV